MPDQLLPIQPVDSAAYNPEKMGKSTLFHSAQMLVGLNAFEAGQEHALHAHEAMDKYYQVLQGEGVLLLEGSEAPMRQGAAVAIPGGVAHGIRNDGPERLLVLAVLAPGPS